MKIYKIFVAEGPKTPSNPCVPSPCGPNSECKIQGENFACTCSPNYIGNPPNCRPECSINPECPTHLACMKQKCRSPCDGVCGVDAQCTVVNHNAICSCLEGFSGDPFSLCQPVARGKLSQNSRMHDFVFFSFYCMLLFKR